MDIDLTLARAIYGTIAAIATITAMMIVARRRKQERPWHWNSKSRTTPPKYPYPVNAVVEHLLETRKRFTVFYKPDKTSSPWEEDEGPIITVSNKHKIQTTYSEPDHILLWPINPEGYFGMPRPIHTTVIDLQEPTAFEQLDNLLR